MAIKFMAVNFVVSGSVFTLMEKIFKDEKQPLFGRADLSLALDPFRTDVLKEIMKDHKSDYSNDDLLEAKVSDMRQTSFGQAEITAGCLSLDEM